MTTPVLLLLAASASYSAAAFATDERRAEDKAAIETILHEVERTHSSTRPRKTQTPARGN